MIDYQEIGNNIKICRIRCNLKQAELAEMVGVTSQHISHVERCQTKPSLTLYCGLQVNTKYTKRSRKPLPR